ncbi:unnamed protein product [Brassica rapa subsp. narinosa]
MVDRNEIIRGFFCWLVSRKTIVDYTCYVFFCKSFMAKLQTELDVATSHAPSLYSRDIKSTVIKY